MAEMDQQVVATANTVDADKDARKIPGASVAVMIVILLIAFACTGFSIMFNILESRNSTPAQTEGPADYIVVAELPEGVAARINGVDIDEDVITGYIMRMREGMELSSDEDWTNWLYEQGYTMDSLRNTVIQYYMNLEIIDQAATLLNIEVTQDDIDKSLNDYVERFGGWDAVNAEMATDGRDMDHLLRWAKSAAQKEKMFVILNGDTIEDPEFDGVVLRSIKISYPEYADVKSLDEVAPAVIEEARDYIIALTNEQAYVNFINTFQSESTIERAPRPADLPYNSDVDIKVFTDAFNGFIDKLTLSQD